MELKIDIFSIIILMGIFQGFFLSYLYLEKQNRQLMSNRLMGFFHIVMALIIAEIFLGYTGAIEKVLFLVDFSEPLNFMIGPLFFLITYSRIRGPITKSKYFHFVPAVIYLLYSGFFFLQSTHYKYNAYMAAFHPDKPLVTANVHFSPDPLGIKGIVNELTIIHLLFYSILTLSIYRKVYIARGIHFFKRVPKHLTWKEISVALFMSIVFIVLYVKLSFKGDLGDYIFAALISVIIYIKSFRLIKGSDLFGSGEGETIGFQKYSKSSLTPELKQVILKRILEIFDNEKPYLDRLFSLPTLAKKVSSTPNHVSQVINESLNKNFYDFLSIYRIKEAKAILSNPKKDNLTMTQIALIVGYNSKSTFNKAFKKITGKTPTEFKKSQLNA